MLSPPKRVKVLPKFQKVVVQECKEGVMGYSKKFPDNPLLPKKRLKIHQNFAKKILCRDKKQHFLNFILLKNDRTLCHHGKVDLKSHFSRGKGAEGYVYALMG